MRKVTVYHYDAFSNVPDKGNPAGVVLEADSFSEKEMQNIAYSVGFNETVFVMKSNKADLKLRYYTPGHEINLCGHATIASLFCLKTRGLIGDRKSVNIETNVGILPIQFGAENHALSIEMKQDSPRFLPFNGDIEMLAKSIGLSKECIDYSTPILYGSTGTWTLLIPIQGLDKFKEMIPNNELFPSILIENPKASIHPFCLETYDKDALMHARHFSSPYSGTLEDPVTGTASGVMGAYYLTYINPELNSVEFIVEQGQEMDRDGRVLVKAINHGKDMDVYITGTAVFVRELEIEYENKWLTNGRK
jgi:PhzF family phenazine biosynthesis protein